MRGHFIITDCETGGVDCNKNPITEIAMVAVDCKTLQELGRYETFIQPYGGLELNPIALQKTQVTMNQVNNGKDFLVAVDDISKFLKEFKLGKNMPLIVGHNIGFDIAFIRTLFGYAKKDLTKILDNNNGEYTRIDTLQIARMIWGMGLVASDNTSFKLTECCERAGIALYDAHGAMNDVMATLKLFKYFCNLSSNVSTTTNETQSRQFFKF